MELYENNDAPLEEEQPIQQEPVPRPESPAEPEPPRYVPPQNHSTYHGTGTGRKESPYANSPYETYQSVRQEYTPGYTFQPQTQPVPKVKKVKKQRKFGGFWKKGLAAVLVVGAVIGFVNGFCMAKFKLHPFIVTLSTQLIVYGCILLFLKLGTNNGQTLSGMSQNYMDLIKGTLFQVGNTAVPKYVLYSAIITCLVWVIWNKTTFGKNMYAVGSNEEAANVSGVNVTKTIVLVFVMAGVLYGITGFMDAARIASVNATTGMNYESDAIAACVIGGISFVGGIGKVSGAIIGVLLLQIIFTGLTYLSVDQNLLFIVKGLIILVACAIDMRKYLVRK